MKKLILLLSILAFASCTNQLDKDYPPVQGNRVEVHNIYIRTYGLNTSAWDAAVKSAYNRDMDKAPVVTE